MKPAILLYRFFQKHKGLFLTGVLICIALSAYFGSRIQLEEDITRFIPKDPKTDKINFVLQNLKIKDKLVINIFQSDTSAPASPEILMAVADSFHSALTRAYGASYIRDFTYRISDDLILQVYNTFYENMPLFLNEKDYEGIAKMLPADSIDRVLKGDYKTLLSPSSVVFSRFIRHDPLNITPLALKKMQSLQFDENFDVHEGYIMSKNRKNLLLFVTPSGTSGETAKNQRFINGVDSIASVLSNANKGQVAVEYYGATAVSVGNARQIKKDSILTTAIALIGIVLVLSLFFRNKLIIFFIVLPVAFGAAFALAVLFLMKTQVSAIALGAGSVILGIAINYSMHFFTHYKRERSVENVIRDLTAPMLIGCTTTVGAFISLMFVKSEALHDFGLFAGFSLIGAVLFTLIVLPHLLKYTASGEIAGQGEEKLNFVEKLVTYRLDKNKAVLIVSAILTLVFCYTAGNVSFESDMMKVNFQDEKLDKAQKHLDELTNFSLRSVYLVSSGKDLNAALLHSEQNLPKLEELKSKGLVKKYSSVSSLLLSDSMQQARINRWDSFWTRARKDSLKSYLVSKGRNYHFRENAFQDFYALLDKKFSVVGESKLDTIRKLVLNDWITENKALTTVVTMVKVDNANKQVIYDAFGDKPNLVVFDRQFMAAQFVDVISSDFMLILVMTSLLVLGFMLLSHGRIELTLINFLPMFISWLWILGLMGILGLKFNIINIIISTFIFGLGDDYSIFIMDGLQNEYKYGRKNLDSYKTSIFMSAVTTIIGIGVLIFAKHPALKSIALITIIGMFTVLFISFVTQPLLYNFLILDRAKRKLLPYTALNLLITVIGFLFFTLGSILVNIVGFVLFYLVPLPKEKKKVFFHRIIQGTCRFMIYLFVTVKKTIINEHGESFGKPAVIICNHQSHIDLGLTLMLHPRIIVFTSDWVWRSPFYGRIARFADFYPASNGYDAGIEKIKERMEAGYSVLIFPEGTRSTDGEIHRFHKGAFLLAEQLQIDILPILIHGAGDCVTKGDFHFKEGSLTLKILERIRPDDTQYGQGYRERTKEICRYMRQEYAVLKKEKETPDYYRSRLIRNYIYKGPVLEWYCRIKLSLEGNYKLFNNLLPLKGVITDVGCGYGFLAYMLNFISKERVLLGIDYDEEKIELANACVSKTDNMRFECGDVTTYDFPQSDAFVISDVLHYLEEEQQEKLIRNCIEKLNPGGMLIIRDANRDLSRRHWGTRYTEFFSTKVLGFNKTSGKGLHFISASRIEETLRSYSYLNFEVLDNTRMTSNIIYVVRNNPRLTAHE
ncbi:MAG TPA: 1-acyl-sn-glycerol-3-phosphate acyltransferase [Bacteroidia bacterium]|nr:1-acyl-sn-glycerol-3-phosphate acyltransferase [Bacteroidia bacterium]